MHNIVSLTNSTNYVQIIPQLRVNQQHSSKKKKVTKR